MTSGRFIVFEGGEGMGKSTQARLLVESLESNGIKARLTREPGGTPGAEAIRSLLLDPPGDGWGPEAEALLFAAARADHVARLIRPALERGEWVVCDRFLDSSRAYQGRAGGVGDEAVLGLHAIGSGGLLPDLTLVLAAETSQVAQRLRERDGDEADAIGGRSDAYHSEVNAAFARFADEEPARFRMIDGDGSIDEVRERVWQAVAPLFETGK
ncbi:dTMP kinase [Qipengyuania gaetbuli]|uniref:dTMP kinase n=1 Tax=Qipengyuania gaetbuli TaxID=266952 RepID=UPI001CD69889|nr:dTMP kinase [Qipengyuania gaetbuli]MCA0911403.1 dTMP kinase [Qipengyuania gaetbuli]